MRYRSNGALFRFNLRAMPPMIWFQFAAAFCLALPLHIFMTKWSGSGFQGELSQVTSLVLGGSVGILYLVGKAGADAKGFALIRNDEFLLTQPLSRVRCYFCFVAGYFVLTLGSMVGEWIVSLFQSDLKFSLRPGNEALQKLDLYRMVFPHSQVVSDTLVIPHGATFLSSWWLLLLAVLALGIQWVLLLPLPAKFKQWAPMLFLVPCMAPLYLMGSSKAHLMEDAFLFFACHRVVVAGGFLALFALVQWCAWARVRRMEVL